MTRDGRASDQPAGTSADLVAERTQQLHALLPEAFTEGRVDFDRLRAALGDVVDGRPERYSFTWAGKRDAIRLLQTPSRATLAPCREESVNFDTTQHLFIEGDNLEVLKLLYKPYAGRVKMIYIDPPYNTGKDFIYPDDFADPLDTYLQLTGQNDAAGNLLTSNPETSGRYHSVWLSMMYPRLFMARQLLTSDGVLFVSISDREFHNLRMILNEIFGEENFLATFVWVNEGNIDNQSKIKTNHEYIVAYARDERSFPPPPVIDPNIPRDSKLYRDYIDNTIVKNGPGNPVTAVTLPVGFPAGFDGGTVEPRGDSWPRLSEPVHVKDRRTQNEVVVSSGWSCRAIFQRFIEGGCEPVQDTKGQQTTFYISETGAICARKRRLERQSHVLTVLRRMGKVQAASAKLAEMGVEFDYPKPYELLKYLVRVGSAEGAIVMDFFAGSCPLAEAVLELNWEDTDSRRRFIVVQLQEPNPKQPAEEGQRLDTIAELGRKRIRGVIGRLESEAEGALGIKREDEAPQDLGFRVFRLAESHHRRWRGVDEKDAEALADEMGVFTDPLVPGWQPMSVIYEVLLKEGLALTSGVEELPENVAKKNKVYRVTDDERGQTLLICLDDDLDTATPKDLGLGKDDVFVCRDAALTDELAANLALQCRLKAI